MGSSRSALELGEKFVKAANTIPNAHKVAVNSAALAAKETMMAGAAAAGLRPGSKIPRHKGVGWGVRYDVVGVANPTALVRYWGPVHLAMFPTKRHVIVPRQAGKAKKAVKAAKGMGITALSGSTGSKAVLSTPYGPRPYVNHPGTKGHNTWPATKAAIVKQTPPIIAAGTRRGLLEAFH